MGLTKLALCLMMLMTLTTTWARTSSERQKETVIKEETSRDRGIVPKRYSRNEGEDETIVTSNSSSEEDSDEHYEAHVRRYARSQAEEFLRKNARNVGGKRRRSLHANDDKKLDVPFSTRRLEKMLEKAICKIIMGDLGTADMLLLKSLNYSLEKVLEIRELKLGKKMSQPRVQEVGESEKIVYDRKIGNDLLEVDNLPTESASVNDLENEDDRSSEMKKKKRKRKKKKMIQKVANTDLSNLAQSVEKIDKDFDFEAYNRQAVYDYENAANNMTQQSEFDAIPASIDYDNRPNDNADFDDANDHKKFDTAMEPHVVFKIRYDDSEFDSSSDEKVKQLSKERVGRVTIKNHRRYDEKSKKTTVDRSLSNNEFSTSGAIGTTPVNNEYKPFQASTLDAPPPLPVVYRLGNFITPREDREKENTEREKIGTIDRYVVVHNDNSSLESSEVNETSLPSTPDSNRSATDPADLSSNDRSKDDARRNSIYEGLEWIEDDVYRVLPEAMDSLNYYDNNDSDMDNDTIENLEINETGSHNLDRRIDRDDKNDTIDYQNENSEGDSYSQTTGSNLLEGNSPNTDLTTYQQLALAHRRDQGQKAMEDIKLKVLAMTGRFNLSSSNNQVQRERLTTFPTICQEPRNTDSEAWSDQFLMNMQFQLNLTSGDHIVAAKLRIYILPQDNITVASSGVNEEEEQEEKKIRISIYFYTKSLKKHRSKKRLMDSAVVTLTSTGSHLALDVREAIRFWRQNLRNSHGNSNNHGLVIQVEDQDGRPLKPLQYIQQDSCHTSDNNEDEKAYQRVPALFVQACSRYVRVVNGEAITYVNCSKSSRNGRH